jgi:hypothetical protein
VRAGGMEPVARTPYLSFYLSRAPSSPERRVGGSAVAVATATATATATTWSNGDAQRRGREPVPRVQSSAPK